MHIMLYITYIHDIAIYSDKPIIQCMQSRETQNIVKDISWELILSFHYLLDIDVIEYYL